MRGVSFEVGDKTMVLRFDFNALCLLEEKTGRTIDGLGSLLAPEGGGAPRVSDLRLMFWAGLGGKSTLDEVGMIASEVGFIEVAKLIMRAFIDAFPQLSAEMAKGSDEAQAAESGNGIGAAA